MYSSEDMQGGGMVVSWEEGWRIYSPTTLFCKFASVPLVLFGPSQMIMLRGKSYN